MDPHAPVYAADGRRVVLTDDADARAKQLTQAVLDAFRDMGASRTALRADAHRLQHDRAFFDSWIATLPDWYPARGAYK